MGVTSDLTFVSAGQRATLTGGSPGLRRHLATALGDPVPATSSPNVLLDLEAGRAPFALASGKLVTRGVTADGAGGAVLHSAGGSGHSQHWTIGASGGRETLTVRSRWQPAPAERAAAAALPVRRRALQAQVLVHYPTLWWAAVQGLAPLHVSILEVEGAVVVLAGPGGVGKSTLVSGERARGGVAMCDNLAATDGETTYGVAEPLRCTSPSSTSRARSWSLPAPAASASPRSLPASKRSAR